MTLVMPGNAKKSGACHLLFTTIMDV